jgi:p-aminobenzoyl-glutamate transporter AbgT
VHTVTSAQTSTTDDQAQRVRRYLTMMGIRIACFGLVFVTSGWVRWTAILAAVFIPYFAVVIANAVSPRQAGSIQSVTPRDDVHRIER